MSATKRILSGSAASWVRIAITVLSQMVFVPVYLSYWDAGTYGVWLAVQALIVILSTLDHGHQTFLEFEFLKMVGEKRANVARVLWSGVSIAVCLGMLVLCVVLGFVYSGVLEKLIGSEAIIHPTLLKDAGKLLILLMVVNVVTSSVGGIYVRVLSPFGYLPRMSWWGVWAGVLITIAPTIAVVCGASFLTAGFVLGVATIGFNVPMFFDIFRLFRKESLLYKEFSFKVGWSNFLLSLVLSAKDLLENLRQQGVRLVLVPFCGAVGLAAFSTMRTGANVALQGLNTVTNPLMPELMRFLHQKNQEKTEASFGTVWIVVIMFLAPGVVLLQAVVKPLFTLWTKGRIAFNPWLFAFLSLGVLVYAVAQPAMAVMRGNNLLRPQLLISILAGSALLVSMLFLVPVYGISGAGVALLTAEILATAGYRIVAKKWLMENGLTWPVKASIIALTSVWLAGITMGAMIQWPGMKWPVLTIGLVLLTGNMYRYWLCLPEVVVKKVKFISSKLPLFNKPVSKVKIIGQYIN